MSDQPSAGQQSWDRIAHRAVEGPLARIIAGLEAVEHDTTSQIAPALKQTVHGSLVTARRLMDMFESLLVVEQINTGSLAIGDTPVSVAIALEPVVRALESRAKAAEIHFEWSATEIALAVAGDEELLRRAVRLAAERVLDDVPKGGRLRVSAVTDGRAVRLRITGSAPTGESAAFSATEPVEIAFARLAVERMGGTVTCVRTPDSGSMIDVLLPVGIAKPATVVTVPEPVVAAPAAVSSTTLPGFPAPAPEAPATASFKVPDLAAPPLEIRLEPPPRLSETPAEIPASTADPSAIKRDGSATPKLEGMTITAPRTGGDNKPVVPGAPAHHAVSSAQPPGTEKMDEPPNSAAPTSGLTITRHVDFDLMSKE